MLGNAVGTALVCIAGMVAMLGGCAVPQRPGAGVEMRLQEPQTKAWYWLYLPQDYVVETVGQDPAGDRAHPLVMTFHGMKPFDHAHAQCREWQQEADRYGFVVCAPELHTPYLTSPLPLTHVIPKLERDEQAILAIMDELIRTVNIDPNAVLATSWSYGGYVAHYMLNRYPERFKCLAVKQSNFSAELLKVENVSRYRDYKIAIFYTENDFAICQRESQEAAIWYSRHGFDLTFAEFAHKGHERIPSLAAAFFAQACGIQAKTPPLELASLQVRELPVLDRAGGELAQAKPLSHDPLPIRPLSPQARKTAARPRPGTQKNQPESGNPVRIRLSSTIGVAPLVISYSVVLPDRLRGKAYFLWTDNGEPVSNGINGQLFLTSAGEHKIEVLVTTEDGQEYRAGRKVTVIERITSRRKTQ